MSKEKMTVVVILGGHPVQVPKFNIGQHRKTVQIMRGDPGDASFAVLELALERVEPKINLEELGVAFHEVSAAVNKILEFSGYEAAVPNG